MGRLTAAVLRLLLVLLSVRLSHGKHPAWVDGRILPVKGRSFRAAVNETVLTSVVVSDLVGTARMSCHISCAASAVDSCPFFEATVGDANLFIGSVLLNATVRLGPLPFSLICTDPVRPSRSAAAAFSVIFVRNASLAFHDPPVTKQLLRLAAETPHLKTPNQTLSLLKALTDVTLSNQLTAVDVALAGATAAAVVETVSAQHNGSAILLLQATRAISGILSSTQSVQTSEAAARVISQLLRLANELAAAIEIDNITLASWNIALGAATIGNESSERIYFGSQNGHSWGAEVVLDNETDSLVSISVRAGELARGRVSFVMVDQTASSAAFSVGGKTVRSPIFSARVELRGGVLLTIPLNLFRYPPFFYPRYILDEFAVCAAWNARFHAWNRQGCRAHVTYNTFTCNCSEHTNLALLTDDELSKLISNLDWLALMMLLNVTVMALGFAISVYCCYAARKRRESREREAGTVLAVERSWITIIMFVIVLIMELNLFVRLTRSRVVGCLGRDAVTLACYLLFSVFSGLEGWQAFLCLVSRIVLNDLHTTNLGSVYGCFNRSWYLMVFVVILLVSIFYSITFFTSSAFSNSGTILYALCQQRPGLAISLGFALPLTLCFAASMLISGLLGYAIVCRSAGLPQKHRSRSRMKAVGYVVCCVSFYAMSMIGLLSDGDTPLALYAFSSLTVLLGATQVVFCCVLRAEIRRQAVRTFACCCRLPCRFWTRTVGRSPDREAQPLLSQVQAPP